jgi:hypothetical protein
MSAGRSSSHGISDGLGPREAVEALVETVDLAIVMVRDVNG